MSIPETEYQSKYLYVRFNQDSTSLCVGTRSGFQLINFQATDDLRMLTGCAEEEIYIAERCFSSSILAYVSLQSPRKVNFLHVERDVMICDPRCYNNSILSVRMNRSRIVVVLEDAIYIHTGLNGEFMADLHRIKQTPCNSKGLCALSPNDENCLLAYPGGPNTGELIIYDCMNLQDKIIIPAHDNPLAAMTFDSAGDKIATASEKGTIIRVHLILDGSCLYEFRRGFTRCANIYSLSFGCNSLFLCASSSTETIHIFKLDTSPANRHKEESTSWIDYLGRASESYLPANISKVFNQERSFAYAKLPLKNLETVCTITMINETPWLMVASYDGYVYLYDLNIAEGGECNLVRQHKLSEIPLAQIDRRDSLTPTGLSYAAAVRGLNQIRSNRMTIINNTNSKKSNKSLGSTPIS
ncbi:WD repeat domain phosphoinositide-interacting protein 2-like isoform X2 [Panonychus citri]|uniref:WD repeat domain phosphoinositide-interacting protein 2-like isoform X2 n=1 Tax=Panonychus citri TaxID=50023 RepID=UPI0023081D25|nr:WD repeat domain phosphoinositide-interacting protein 2-like isoform X2 [Panonychus citri]XP_053206490.1 WD repeat domain phosphoinositide-interacting protein 2-like isoform X2 [Panonychus citri]